MAALPEIVLDAVLLPFGPIAERCAEVSRSLSSYGTEFVLDTGRIVPHLSLYMGRFEPTAYQALAGLGFTGATLTATAYRADPEQGMFEIGYEPTDQLVDLQRRVVAALDPLRCAPRTYDPVGRRLADWGPTTTGELRDNLDRYGYDEIGPLFRPHVTLTRFRRRALSPDIGALPPPAAFSGSFPRLALLPMGPHGTCYPG